METWVERPHAAGHTSDPEAAAWSLQLPPETAADMAFRLRPISAKPPLTTSNKVVTLP
ncbi:hypothetical protein [Sandarakinorhabdus cyanobacteriorum]|nr:hypothetical protein [Sandarakinorhabdus cyanobacteriorum]